MRPPLPYEYMPPVPPFAVDSDDIAEQQMIADEYVYDGFGLPGKNLSPGLRWHGFPPQTRSFGVTCFDVDVATSTVQVERKCVFKGLAGVLAEKLGLFADIRLASLKRLLEMPTTLIDLTVNFGT